MKKYIISIFAIVIAFSAGLLSGCGYEGSYRYPCQDPVNWEKEECKPPLCDASGTCPENIFGSIP